MMSGQPQEWQTDVFRSSLVRKLEEAIRDSGNQTEKNAVDLEKQVCIAGLNTNAKFELLIV